ncbi:LOB domain-containing protein 38-like [Andrographis paniculata]|uniref:LOB domain-containing protein 38-like n=1 Tax=Andrographis paniculata TaxID=175694 RepID=UPI0021E7287E|nr:LOB domain-containing protein 38-like [Andrographis paniculata]
MSCNGCRVLRRGCSERCVLKPCLEWIESPQAQGNAILFVSKFFGRTDLISFVSAVAEAKRPALFQSLLFEACGRTVNPVSGAVGLLSTGNWHICQAAVNTVLDGGALRPVPISGGIVHPNHEDEESEAFAWSGRHSSSSSRSQPTTAVRGRESPYSAVVGKTASYGSEVTAEFSRKEPKLLNLFA